TSHRAGSPIRDTDDLVVHEVCARVPSLSQKAGGLDSESSILKFDLTPVRFHRGIRLSPTVQPKGGEWGKTSMRRPRKSDVINSTVLLQVPGHIDHHDTLLTMQKQVRLQPGGSLIVQ